MLKFYAATAGFIAAFLAGVPALAQAPKSNHSMITQRAERVLPVSNLAGAGVIDNLFPVTLPGGEGDVRSLMTLTSQPSPLMVGMRAGEPGVKDLPFTGTFTSQEEVYQYGVIDMNRDNCTWEWKSYDYCMKIWSADDIDSDDWLVLPPLSLKAGTNYKFVVSCRNKNSSSTDYTELFEVKAGQYVAMDSVNMPITVMDVTPLKTNNYVDMQGIFSVPEDGKYYVGIHYISPKWQSYMEVIKVEVKVDAGEPAPVDNLTITPGESGARTATLTFTTPSLTAAGESLESIDTVFIERNEVIVNKIINPAPGTELVWTDNLDEAGEYRYKVYCVNGRGESLPAYAVTYVGFDIPMVPDSAWIKVKEPLKDGNVEVNWTPVVTDTLGRSLPTEAVTYEVRNLNISGYPVMVATKPGQTSATVNLLAPGVSQTFSNVGVFAVTERGLGVGAPTENKVVVGTPASLPFVESFPGGSIATKEIAISNFTPGMTRWILCTDETFSGGIVSADGDNGFLSMQSSVNGESMIYTLMVDLAGAKNPELSISLFNIESNTADDDNKNTNEVTLLAREPNAETWTTLKTGSIHELAPEVMAWNRVHASLGEFKGKVVQIGVKIKGKKYAYTAVDALAVEDVRQADLAVTGVSAPRAVLAGEVFDVTAEVANVGAAAVSAHSYKLKLVEAGTDEPLSVLDGCLLERDAKAKFTFDAVFTPTHTGKRELMVVVDFADDENIADNNGRCTVDCKVSDRPVPQSLEVSPGENNKPVLTWQAPDLTSKVYTDEPVVEDFENPAYTAWNTLDGGVDGWIMVDVDGKPIGGFQGVTLPGISTGVTTSSFFVFDSADDAVASNQYAASYAANSGTSYLASIFRADDGQVDDWAISPALSGKKQELSLYARSYSASYPETFGIYYSTGSVDPRDFVLITSSEVTKVPGEWTQYKADLPAGAARFAIRSYAAGAFMLMIDDVKFVPKSNTSAEVLGYYIYRNDVKLNNIPVSTLTYADNEAVDGTHRYYVTALYDTNEESAPSNIVSAISAVDLIGTGAPVVTTGPGEIVVAGSHYPVDILNMQGISIYHSARADVVRIKVAPGIYFVRSGNTVTKLLVV